MKWNYLISHHWEVGKTRLTHFEEEEKPKYAGSPNGNFNFPELTNNLFNIRRSA